MAGYADMLQGTAGPMDMRSLAGQMGMGAQQQAVGGPVQMAGGMPPGGMDMMAQMGGPMQGAPPGPGPMGAPGMANPMAGGAPPDSVSPESGIGMQTLLQFSNMSDEDIIQLVLTTKVPEEASEVLMALGQTLGRPMLIEAGQQAAQGGPEAMAGMAPTMEGMGG